MSNPTGSMVCMVLQYCFLPADRYDYVRGLTRFGQVTGGGHPATAKLRLRCLRTGGGVPDSCAASPPISGGMHQPDAFRLPGADVVRCGGSITSGREVDSLSGFRGLSQEQMYSAGFTGCWGSLSHALVPPP